MQLLVTLLVSAIAVMVAAYIIPGITVAGFGTALVVAIVLGIVNALIRPLIVLLTLPVTIVTLGLFLFVINALMVLLVAKIVPGFKVSGFIAALLFSLVVAIVGSFLGGMKFPNA